MAQQGPPPRRPGRHSAPDPEPGQYDAQPYDDQPYDDQRGGQPDAGPYAAGPYAADPYVADPYAAGPRPADPRGAQPPYGPPDDPYPGPSAPRADPYASGADPYGSRADPYAAGGDSNRPRGSYAPEPGSSGPHGADPYGAGPNVADPYSAGSNGADPYGAGSNGADPYGGDSRGADPYGADSYRPEAYQPRRAAAPSYAPPGSPAGRPEAERPEPPRVPVPARAAPAAPARRAASRPASSPGRGAPWASADPFTAGADDEDDLPPWAGLTIRPARAAGTRTRPARGHDTGEQDAAPDEADAADPAAAPRRRGLGRGRAAAARLRKSRRRVYVYCGTAVVLAVAVAGYLALRALPKHTPAPSFITTLQPGEFATVPAACNSVSPALLASYLPGGPVTKVNPAGTSASLAQCSFTVDRKPVFRVLNVTAQAYQPSAVAAGNGSATANAVDNFVIAEQTLRAPGKKSAVPPAAVTLITGLGTEAFRAVQVIHASTGVNDLVTVMARQRNLVVTVTLQAQASGGGFGPVDAGSIEAGALAVARAVLAHDTSPAAAG